jgi:hypothetical protein
MAAISAALFLDGLLSQTVPVSRIFVTSRCNVVLFGTARRNTHCLKIYGQKQKISM